MTDRQATEIFNQENKFINTFGKDKVEVLVTYYKQMKTLVNAKPIDYYKVVTRTCKSNENYYDTEMGKASLAKGNPKKDMAGTTGHKQNDQGQDVEGTYTSNRGDRYRFYPDMNVEDKIQYYVNLKRVDYKDIEDLVNQGVLDKSELRTRPASKYMGLYLETIANIVVRHKDSGKEIVADTSVPPYVK